jgi:hypothetical protein
VAQQNFDDSLAKILDGVADWLKGKASERKENLKDVFERLKRTVRSSCSKETQGLLGPNLQSFTLFLLAPTIQSDPNWPQSAARRIRIYTAVLAQSTRAGKADLLLLRDKAAFPNLVLLHF